MNEEKSLTVRDESRLSVSTIREQINAVQAVMKDCMKQDTHFGLIPGCGDKPTLLKPGAELLSTMFQLRPGIDIDEKELPGGHREYKVIVSMHDRESRLMGQGVGLCSTMESKYRYRTAQRKCPSCQQEGTIIKGNPKYGGGWVCWDKRGGCKAKFQDGDKRVEDQKPGKTENPDIADTYNTVLKIAKKRALVDATLTTTACSDIFTQDIEDMPVESTKRPVESTNGASPKPTPRTVKKEPVGPVFRYNLAYAASEIPEGEQKDVFERVKKEYGAWKEGSHVLSNQPINNWEAYFDGSDTEYEELCKQVQYKEPNIK